MANSFDLLIESLEDEFELEFVVERETDNDTETGTKEKSFFDLGLFDEY